MVKISIIIPIFNSERELNRCVDSVLNQNFKDFEIILINDGSTDRSGFICEEYKKKDNRISIVHCENGGVSKARNIGLSRANGEFIMFMDSDDWIESNTLEVLYKNIDGRELIIYGFVYDLYKKETLIRSSIKSTLSDYNINNSNISEKFRYLFNTIDFSSSCNKLFKGSIIRNNNIMFNENMGIFEDLYFNIKVLKKVNDIKIIHNVLYHYTSNNEIFHLNKRKSNICEDILIVADKLLEYIEEININLYDREEIYGYCLTIYGLCLKSIATNHKNLNFYDKLIQLKKMSRNRNFMMIIDKYNNNLLNKYLLLLLRKNFYLSSYFLIKWKVK